MDYRPSPTCCDFMVSDALVKCIIGPLGSGKSMAGIMELFRRACEQAPDAYGVRPTRFVVVRNTLSQLRTTFLADVRQYLEPFFGFKVTESTLQFRFTLNDGTRVESDWMLMPLERPEDARKLLSLNLTAALIEECREVDYEVVAALMGRIGRYPSKARVDPTWQALMMISNPWSESSDYHEHFVLNLPADWRFFHMPGGMSVEAENTEFLPNNYYERLMDGHSDEWINVHVHAQFGDDQFGQAVYRSSFKRDTHAWDKAALKHNPQLPLIIGIDFGRTPAVAITQKDLYGRILVLRELTSEDMNLNQFCQQLLVPCLHENFPNTSAFFVGDPAGIAKSQFSEENCFDVLNNYNLRSVPAPTNDPEARIRAVEKALLQSFNNLPGLLVDNFNCPTLVRGFLRDYRYKKQRSGLLTPTPEKNGASHVHDALQYAVLGQQSDYVGRRIFAKTRPQGVRPQRFSATAWT